MSNANRSIWYYIRQYRFRSLLIRNWGFIMLAIIIPMITVMGFGYRKLEEEMNLRMMGMNRELLQKSAAVTDNVIESLSDFLENAASNPDVAYVLMSEKWDAAFEETVNRLFDTAEDYTKINPFIRSAYFYSDVNEYIFDGQTRSVSSAKRYPQKGKWYYIHKQIDMRSQYLLTNRENSMLFCHPLFSASGEKYGIMVLDVQLVRIRDLLEREELLQNGLFFVTDVISQVVYCNQSDYFTWSESNRQQYINAIGRVPTGETVILEDGVTKVVSVMKSAQEGLKYALITEMPGYKEETQTLNNFLITSLSTGLLASVIVSYIITFITYRPVKRIVDVIEKPQLYWQDKSETKRSNELLYITSNILNTLSSREKMNKEMEMRMEALRRAQSLALQFQIDPHFLYNTLETVRWCAIEENGGLSNKTSRLISKVAGLYRIALGSDNVILPLEEELGFLKVYVDLLKARFGEDIHFEWKIDESLYKCSVIKMSVQPLIENAVNHGLKPLAYAGTIRISAYQDGKRLCIAVENDGESMDSVTMQQINQKLEAREEFAMHKVGLHNVNERVKLIYGNEYGVTLYKIAEEGRNGTKAVITFPYLKNM